MKATLYEKDYFLWLEETVQLLKEGKWSELDSENLIDEILTMANSQRRSLKSNLVVILWHLLKYLCQPEKQTNSWKLTLFEHRERIEEDLESSPSLTNILTSEVFAQCYEKARKKASIETGLSLEQFPLSSPFTLEEALDYNFIPNERN